MSDAAAQLRRILTLVPELGDDEEHPLDALTARLGTDRATLLHDLRSLTERFDDPAGFVDEGVALYIERDRVSLTSPHFRRPMRLTAAELCALELGLAMLASERPPEERAAIERARGRVARLVTTLPADDDATLRHAELAAPGPAAAHAALRAAVAAQRKVRLTYRRAGQAAASERVIAPYALLVASGAWYTVAHCERSDGVRIFRLDRVERAEPLAERFVPPPGFSLDALLQDGRAFHAAGARAMTVRYSPRIARWIAEREARALDADGSLTLEHPLADDEWAVRHVLQYAADAEVLAPVEVRALVAARLRAMGG